MIDGLSLRNWTACEYIYFFILHYCFHFYIIFRAGGEFEAIFTGPFLIPAVPIRGEFETLFGHVSLTMAVRLARFVHLSLFYTWYMIIIIVLNIL